METKIDSATLTGSSKTVNIITEAFGWMFIGLLLTGGVGLLATRYPVLNIFNSAFPLFFILVIAELALVVVLSKRITKMSFGGALFAFVIYSLLNGLILSAIFLTYTIASITAAFFSSAVVFGVMALYGYTAKKDLTSLGNLLMMGLIGVIVASLVNLFIANNTFSYVLSYIIILLFIFLTAYDTQRIKMMTSDQSTENLAILAALMLYLDFVNIFINVLNVIGRKR